MEDNVITIIRMDERGELVGDEEETIAVVYSTEEARQNGDNETSLTGHETQPPPPDRCRAHDRLICPECLHGCRQISSDASKHPKTIEDLRVAEGDKVFVTTARDCSSSSSSSNIDHLDPDSNDSENQPLIFTWSRRLDNGTEDGDAKLRQIYAHVAGRDPGIRSPLAADMGWLPRFVPQLDEQVVGVDELLGRTRSLRACRLLPPASSPQHRPEKEKVLLDYCEACQLTWLRGSSCETRHYYLHSHPTHCALRPRDAFALLLEQRSLVIWVDGQMITMMDNDTPDRESADGGGTGRMGKVGVWFGGGSRYNRSERFYFVDDGGCQAINKQGIETLAARLALLVLRDEVLPRWTADVEEYDNKRARSRSDGVSNLSDDNETSGTHGHGEEEESLKSDDQQGLVVDEDPGGERGKKKDKNGKCKKRREKNMKKKAVQFRKEAKEEKEDELVEDVEQQELEGEEPVQAHAKQHAVERPFELTASERRSLLKTQQQRQREEEADGERESSLDLRVILTTHSRELYDLFTQQVRRWTFDAETQTYYRRAYSRKNVKRGTGIRSNDAAGGGSTTTTTTRPVPNSKAVLDVLGATEDLAAYNGVEVAWWHVPRDGNAGARGLTLAGPTEAGHGDGGEEEEEAGKYEMMSVAIEDVLDLEVVNDLVAAG